MQVGIPKEIKVHESRVAITPDGVSELVRAGHEVFIETGAGLGSAITDSDFVAHGAKILATADEVWSATELILKVYCECTILIKSIIFYLYRSKFNWKYI